MTAEDSLQQVGWERCGGLLLQLGQIIQASEPRFTPVPRKSVPEKLSPLVVVLFLTPLHTTEGEKPYYPLLKTKSKAALELSPEANRVMGSSAKQNWVQQGSVSEAVKP